MFVIQCDGTKSLKTKDQKWFTIGQPFPTLEEATIALLTKPFVHSTSFGYRVAEIDNYGVVIKAGRDLNFN